MDTAREQALVFGSGVLDAAVLRVLPGLVERAQRGCGEAAAEEIEL